MRKQKTFAPDTKRNRKLLLHKSEIAKLLKEKTIKGMTIVPTKVYIKDGFVKVEIALAKGKKLYDKRQTKANEVVKREIDRSLKSDLEGR